MDGEMVLGCKQFRGKGQAGKESPSVSDKQREIAALLHSLTCNGHFVSTQLPREERDVRLSRAMAALPADLQDWARGKLVQNNKSLREKSLDVFQAHAAEATRMLGDTSQAADRIAYPPDPTRFAAQAAVIVSLLRHFYPETRWMERVSALMGVTPEADPVAMGFNASWKYDPFWKLSPPDLDPSCDI